MNFRLPAFALLTVLLALPHAYGQMSGASYLETINQAPTTLTLNSSSSVVDLETPPTLSAVVSYPRSGQTTGNVTFTVENGSAVVATGTAPVNLTGVATWISLPPKWHVHDLCGLQWGFKSSGQHIAVYLPDRPRPPRISASRSHHSPLPRVSRQLRRSRSRRSMASTARSHSPVPHRPPRWIAVCRRLFSRCRLPHPRQPLQFLPAVSH